MHDWYRGFSGQPLSKTPSVVDSNVATGATLYDLHIVVLSLDVFRVHYLYIFRVPRYTGTYKVRKLYTKNT